jgi:cardiolipin synthase
MGTRVEPQTPSVAPIAIDAAPADVIELLRDGAEAFPRIFAAVRAAQREVLVEMYWLDSTAVGRELVEALTERARAGVAVRVLYDAIGSLGVDRAMYDPLLAAGGKVREFNPIAPWRQRFRVTAVSRRDHRKVIVVDRHTAFVGGLNIGMEWVPPGSGGGGWRDDVAEVRGPNCERVRALFYDVWCAQGGAAPDDVAPRTRRELAGIARRELSRDDVTLLGHDAWGARRAIRRVYLSRINRARRRVHIVNPYFVPDGAVLRALHRAARRGAEVVVVVPRMSDVAAVTWAGRALYAWMLRRGIKVYEWTGPMLHAKSALVDDWATTGSYNLDYRSLRYNLEANVASAQPAFVDAMARSIRSDLKAYCAALDLETWSRRPWLEKVRETFFYVFRKFL